MLNQLNVQHQVSLALLSLGFRQAVGATLTLAVLRLDSNWLKLVRASASVRLGVLVA